MKEREARHEIIGFLTYQGDRLPIVNISENGALISCADSEFEVGQVFRTVVEARDRGEKSVFNATVTVVRVDEDLVGISLNRD